MLGQARPTFIGRGSIRLLEQIRSHVMKHPQNHWAFLLLITFLLFWRKVTGLFFQSDHFLIARQLWFTWLFIISFQRKSLLEVIKETVLSHLTKKCPPHVRPLPTLLPFCLSHLLLTLLLNDELLFHMVSGSSYWPALQNSPKREQTWIIEASGCRWWCISRWEWHKSSSSGGQFKWHS